MTDDKRVPLPLTEWAVADLSPNDWRHVANFLTGLLLRKPIASGENDVSGWRAEKWILGSLATELRLLASEAGEPDSPPRTFGRDPLERERERLEELERVRTRERYA